MRLGGADADRAPFANEVNGGDESSTWTRTRPGVAFVSASATRSKWYGGVVRKDSTSALVRVKSTDGGTSVLRVPTTSLVARAAKEGRSKKAV